MNSPTSSATELFAAHWNVYQQVVANNYMFHREIYAAVRQLLGALDSAPLGLLDLGCGDASNLAPLLNDLRPASYTGVDLSGVALQLAARNLAGLAGPVNLHQVDMQEFLRTTDSRYSVIFSSFALHHLEAEGKQAFLTGCREHLDASGCLILIDVAREEDQDLPGYLDAYCVTVATDWTSLTDAERCDIIEHVRGNDLPERVSDLAAMADRAGFSRFETVDRFTAHHLFKLSA